MYFRVNTAFINYLENLTDSWKIPILLNWTTHEQTIPISLQSFYWNLQKTLKDFVHQFQHKMEIFDFWKKHNDDLDLAKKNSFLNNYTLDIFSVCYCHYFISCYFNSSIHNMQTCQIKILSNQSWFTAIKRSVCSNQAGTCLNDTWNWMYL